MAEPQLNSLPARIREHIKVDKCWIWNGASGYGQVTWEGRVIGAHRLVYMLLVGPIPEGALIHHRCRRPACVRPDHLEVVTHIEHGQRHPRGPAPNRTPASSVVGENLRRLKEASGESWHDLAVAAGVGVRQIHGWASGRHTPRKANLERLAAVFGVSVDELKSQSMLEEGRHAAPAE